jgi:serine/threonine protein kinase
MTSTPPPGLPQPGDVLAGKYKVERILGQGGMGIVYAAEHQLLAQKVAVKLLLAEGAQRAEASMRFLQEARSAARVQHENIARVSDVGTLENGTPYMVMEYLEGSDLSVLLQGLGPLEVSTAVDYVLQALEAVGQAHALGIVHRDLKPANLFLAKKIDGTSIVKVLDFGISKTIDPLHSGAQTSTQSLLGSPYYMSPEQLRSSKNVDKRADIWSVGIILYELLTGILPFQADSLGGLFAAILENEAASMTTRRKEIPPGLDAVVTKCLSRRPEDRYADVAELAWALSPYASPLGQASAQRIQSRGMGSTGNGARLSSAGITAPGAITGGGRTAASWQTSQSGARPASKAWIFGAIGATAAIAIGAFAIWQLRGDVSASSSASAEIANLHSAAPSTIAPGAAAPAEKPTVTVGASDAPAPEESDSPAASSAAPKDPRAHGSPAKEAASEPPRPATPAGKGRPAAHAHAPAPSAAPRASSPTYDPTKDSRF